MDLLTEYRLEKPELWKQIENSCDELISDENSGELIAIYSFEFARAMQGSE